MKQFAYILMSITTAILLSCTDLASKRVHSSTRSTKQNLEYSSVELFTIDSSIYDEMDTIWRFPDGRRAYDFFFHGGAFIDSQGVPIHDRYKMFVLTKEQNETLKDSFLYKLCDEVGHACTPMYRDVLLFYDSSHKVIQQAQICFGCGDTQLYPVRDFMCQYKEGLDYKVFQRFIYKVNGQNAYR